MNLSNAATLDQLKELISGCDDDQNSHVVWVDTEGEVRVTPIPAGKTPAGWAEERRGQIRFRFDIQPEMRGRHDPGPALAGC